MAWSKETVLAANARTPGAKDKKKRKRRGAGIKNRNEPHGAKLGPGERIMWDPMDKEYQLERRNKNTGKWEYIGVADHPSAYGAKPPRD